MIRQARHRRIALLAIILLFIAAFACAQAEQSPKKTTVMIYMCGSDLEAENATATRVLGEMRASKFNLDEVNVIALLGGSTRWWYGYDSDMLNVVQVGGSRYPTVIDQMEWASMGNPDTLSGFLRFCNENYPAERNILVFWDHGGGPNEGVCYDLIAQKREHRTDTLTTLEMESGLKNSPFADGGLDLIVFHACLMGSAEVATRIAPYAQYMVASEEVNYGIGYSWLKGLEEDPNALETAKRIADASYELNQGIDDHLTNVFSVVDLAKMPQLNEAMDAFFAHIPNPLEVDSFTTLSNVLVDVESFGVDEEGSGNDSDLMDLGDLVNRYRFAVPDYADNLLESIQEALVYCRTSKDSCTGLSVYHPFANRYGANSILSDYDSLGFSQRYTDYVGQFASILCGAPLSNVSNLLITPEVGNKAESAQFSFSLDLTGEQAAAVRGATLNVLKREPDGAYRFAYSNKAVVEDGRIHGEYRNIALYAVDADGNPISEPLEYHLTDDGFYMIPAELSRDDGKVLNEEGDIEAAWDSGTHSVLIACAHDPEANALIPHAVTVRDESSGLYVTAYGTSFNSYKTIRQEQVSRKAPADGVDPMPAFSQWEAVGTDAWEAAIDGSWSFRLLENRLPTENICVTYQITDIQSNTYSSKLLKLVPQESENLVLYDNAAFDIEVGSFQLTVRDDTLIPALILHYKRDDAVYMMLENVQIDGMPLDGVGEAYGEGSNGAFGRGDRVSLSAECALPPDFDQDIAAVTFDVNLYDADTDELVLTVPIEVKIG